MARNIRQIKWKSYLKQELKREIYDIDLYLLLSEDIDFLPTFSDYFKIDVSISIICTQGEMKINIGSKQYEAIAPCMINLPVNETIQYEYMSDNFEGLFVFVSKDLTEDLYLNIKDRLSLSYSTHANPIIPLSDKELESNRIHYHVLKNTLQKGDNVHIKKIMFHLLLSFYFQQHNNISESVLPAEYLSKHNSILMRFFKLIEENYKEERQAGFYAERLHFTPKYLSQLIKSNTGKSINDWVNELVIIEAKALLKNSPLSIQQISEELSFNEQATFSKYFKSHEKLTPNQYRNLHRLL